MKYVVAWETRQSTSEADDARSLQLFSKWGPSEGSDFQQFLGRLDGRGGFAVIETEDPQTVLRDTATFGPFFEFSVYPVLEIMDSARISGEAIEFRSSVS